MSYGGQYNLNQRVTYLESIIQTLAPFLPFNLSNVLALGNTADNSIILQDALSQNEMNQTSLTITDSTGEQLNLSLQGLVFNNSSATTTISNDSGQDIDITADGSLNLTSTTSSIVLNSTQLPRAPLSILPASNDSSDFIPTTQWVQSALNSLSSSSIYTTNQTVTTPANCRSIDLLVMGAGGAAGDLYMDPITFINYFGGSGSGGNCISANGIPMGAGENLVLTFSTTSTTGSTTVTLNSVILARAFNGNKGTNGSLNTDAAGGTTNNTIGVGDTSFTSWYNTFGNAGGASRSSGTQDPDMTVALVSCPKGNSTWVDGDLGMGEKLQGSGQGGGYVLITFHLGV